MQVAKAIHDVIHWNWAGLCFVVGIFPASGVVCEALRRWSLKAPAVMRKGVPAMDRELRARLMDPIRGARGRVSYRAHTEGEKMVVDFAESPVIRAAVLRGWTSGSDE